MQFSATLDTRARAVTAGTTLLFLGIIVLQLFHLEAGARLTLPLAAMFIAIYGVTYLLRPVAYEVKNGQIIIRRLLNSIRINTDEIVRTEQLTREDLKWSLRTFGSGGFFGYFGHFSHRKFGAMRWYATRRDNHILIYIRNGRKLLFTPDEPASFLEAIEKASPGLVSHH